MNGMFETLLGAAVRAPSGDNLQPWRFVVDREAGSIALSVDERRDRSPMNPGQRMSRIAVGAALENILRTAQHNGWHSDLEPAGPSALAGIRFRRPVAARGTIDEVLQARVTNRRVYDGRALPADMFAALARQTPVLDGVRTHWMMDRERLLDWASLVSCADTLVFREKSRRRALLSNLRFSAAGPGLPEDGLTAASLELSVAQRLALRLAVRAPNWVVKCSGLLRLVASHTRRLVRSASGLCLVVAPDGTERTDLRVGQAMQRAWLALTAAGLAVQPMMSPVILSALPDSRSEPGQEAPGFEELAALRTALRQAAPEIDGGRLAFLMRFGYAPPPTSRTGRLALEDVTTEAVLENSSSGSWRKVGPMRW